MASLISDPMGRSDMHLISSRMTRFHKASLPVFAAVFVLIIAVLAFALDEVSLPLLLMLAVIPLAALFKYRARTFPLADEVWDCGDALFIRQGGAGRRIAFSRIRTIDHGDYPNPHTLGLVLCDPQEFGGKVAFVLPFRLFFLTKSPVQKDLERRITEAKCRS